MRKVFILGVALLMAMLIAGTALAEFGKLDLKVGEAVFACDCGADCPCQSMAKKAGNCTCGKAMVSAKVTKVADGMAYLQAPGWEKPRAFNMVGKYACNCGPACDCNFISQNPGKCVCGNDLKKVS
jgi:hypothetical protein